MSPSPPDNGFIAGSDFREGARVHVLCEEGYVLTGPSELTCIACTFCSSGGIWSPEEKYSCERCGGGQNTPCLQNTRNHTLLPSTKTTRTWPLQGSNYSLDASVHIFCDPGYTLSGQDHITCLRVPDPFKNVVAWEPMDMPRCQIMPPSLLPMGLRGGRSEIKGITSHRLTDTSPRTIPTEGLPHICFLPKVVGPCQMYLPRFYFDPSIEECTSFVYGGCGGNENNFESMDICQHKCR
ncbi:hypothetical protein C0Q70_05870 [Pomacea canaliculata]|uniref:BPTI/Kunitz inhibitor domain-containing protein n=1 Tax=Pomacea canaliculata TaxID=400727 RepID=A0A2T7PMF7_POMCA|nr:hypothetical protein C0Q70_05870 [Pomacea canaliculata]